MEKISITLFILYVNFYHTSQSVVAVEICVVSHQHGAVCLD